MDTVWKAVNYFNNFWKRQEKFISDDLKKCNKTAWLLPDYEAQQLNRMLYQRGQHSDVGVREYFKSNLNFNFEGTVFSSLIERASLIPSSGLLDWWTDLINRTDLVRRIENEPPVKPTMYGNIQIIFLLLIGGMTIAQMSMIFELHGYIFEMLYWLCVSAPLSIMKQFQILVQRHLQKTRTELIAH